MARAKRNWNDMKKVIKDSKKTYTADERIYKVQYNEKKQTKVVMRFIDSPDTDLPYITLASHFVKDVGGMCIANCMSSIKDGKQGGVCPICDDVYKNDYYNTDYELYKGRKKSIYHYTNVLIIDDENHPENNGKVFIYKFGKKIMDKIDECIEEGNMPWDPDNGVNFILSSKHTGEISQADSSASRFREVSTKLSEYGDEDEIQDRAYELAPFLAPSNFVEYGDLEARYQKVIGGAVNNSPAPARVKKAVVEDDSMDDLEEETFDDFEDEDVVVDDTDDDDEFFNDLDD